MEPRISTAEIIRQLEYPPSNKFPCEAMEAAMERKEEITPYLLKLLETLNQTDAVDDEYWGHLAALYLLAYFREQTAFPLIVELLSRDDDQLELLLGDAITEGIPQVLASTCDGNIEWLVKGAERSDLSDWARVAFLDALKPLYGDNQLSRSEIEGYLRLAFRERRFGDNQLVNSMAANLAIDLKLSGLEEELRDAFCNDQFDESLVNDAAINSMVSAPDFVTPESIKARRGNHLINREDVFSMSNWFDSPGLIQMNGFDYNFTRTDKTKEIRQKKKKKRKAIKLQRRKNR